MEKWTAGRKAVLPSLSRLGEKFVSVSLADDMGVPISEIPKAVVAFQKIAQKYGIIVGTYGHASDGNLHTKVLVDPWSKDFWAAAEKAVGEIFDTTIALGGTVTGEHGTGISKAPYMQKERASALKTMIAIKRALDPNNIMNPHKMFDWEKTIIYSLRYPAGL
jgi:glycolate oxidase